MSLGLFQRLEFLGSGQSVDIRHITLFYNFVSYWQYYARGGPTLPDNADILFLLPDVQTRFNMVQSEPVILETPTSTMAFSVRLARSCPLQEAFLALLMLQISDRTDLDQVFRLKFLLPSQRPGASKSEILLKQPWGRIFALNRHYFFSHANLEDERVFASLESFFKQNGRTCHSLVSSATSSTEDLSIPPPPAPPLPHDGTPSSPASPSQPVLSALDLYNSFRTFARTHARLIEDHLNDRVKRLYTLLHSQEAMHTAKFLLFYENNDEKRPERKRRPITFTIPLPPLITDYLKAHRINHVGIQQVTPKWHKSRIESCLSDLEAEARASGWLFGAEGTQGTNYIVDEATDVVNSAVQTEAQNLMRQQSSVRCIEFQRLLFQPGITPRLRVNLCVWTDAATARSRSRTAGTITVLDPDCLLFSRGYSTHLPLFECFAGESRIPTACVEARCSSILSLFTHTHQPIFLGNSERQRFEVEVLEVLFNADNSSLAIETGSQKSGGRRRCPLCGIDVPRWALDFIDTDLPEFSLTSLTSHVEMFRMQQQGISVAQSSTSELSESEKKTIRQEMEEHLVTNKRCYPLLAASSPLGLIREFSDRILFLPASFHNLGHLSWTGVSILNQVLARRASPQGTNVPMEAIKAFCHALLQKCCGTSLSRQQLHTYHLRHALSCADVIWGGLVHDMFLSVGAAIAEMNRAIWSTHLLTPEAIFFFFCNAVAVVIVIESIHHACGGSREQGNKPTLLGNIYLHSIIYHTTAALRHCFEHKIVPISVCEEGPEQTHQHFKRFAHRISRFTADDCKKLRLMQLNAMKVQEEVGWKGAKWKHFQRVDATPTSVRIESCLFQGL